MKQKIVKTGLRFLFLNTRDMNTFSLRTLSRSSLSSPFVNVIQNPLRSETTHQLLNIRTFSKNQQPISTIKITALLRNMGTLEKIFFSDPKSASEIKKDINILEIVDLLNQALDEDNGKLVKEILSKMYILYHYMHDDCMSLLKSNTVSFMALVNRLESLEMFDKIFEGEDKVSYRSIDVFLQLSLIEAASKLDLEFIREYWNSPNRSWGREVLVSIFQAKGPLPKKIEVLLSYQVMGGGNSQASLRYTDDRGNNYLHWLFREDAEPWYIQPELIWRLIPISDGHSGYSAQEVFTHKNEEGVSPIDILLESKNPYADKIIKTVMVCDFKLDKGSDTDSNVMGKKFR